MVLGLCMAAPMAFAQTTSDGTVSIELTKQLYCGAQSLIEGNLGLILGLVFVGSGVWALIKGGKWVPSLILMVSGALLTALPSLIGSFFEGYGSMLSAAGIGTSEFLNVGSTCGLSTVTSTQVGVRNQNTGKFEMSKMVVDTGVNNGTPQY